VGWIRLDHELSEIQLVGLLVIMFRYVHQCKYRISTGRPVQV
jgi:hypothetical protein